MAPPPRRDRVLLVAFFLSGCAALGYEIVWTRVLALALGNEVLAVLGVLAGFFGGMALGAFVMHDRVRKAINPGHLFARLEIAAAVFAALSPWILAKLAHVLPRVLGPMAGDNDSGGAIVISVLVAGALLLPGSFCLGATLPALVEARRRALPTDPEGRGIGRLYAANTIGATVGVLVTVHVLVPGLGMGLGALVLAALGMCSAGLALRWCAHVDDRSARRSGPEPVARPPIDASRDPDPDILSEPRVLLALMFGTGLVGIGLEVVGIRVLSQLLEKTIYTFADVLAVYLLGTGIGAAIYGRLAARAVAGRPAIVAGGMIIALALLTSLAARTLEQAPALLSWWAPAGSSHGRHMLAEGLLAACVFGPATIVMGALFSHVAGLLAPRGVGRAYALNTLGSALAPFVFGVWAIPELGYRDTMATVAIAYVILFAGFTWFRRFGLAMQLLPIAIAVWAAIFAAPASLSLIDVGEDWKVIEKRETLLGLVLVAEQQEAPTEGKPAGMPLRRLYVDQRFRMGGSHAFGERRMGHIPLLLHPHASEALFLGVGTGATLSAVRDAPLQRVDAVEIVAAVVDQMHYFDEINAKVYEDSRVTIHAADARRFVAASTSAYDVVVADLFHPAIDGAGNLYSREHFENVRARLRAGGLFAQWLPLYQLDPATLRIICRTFVDVFGEAHALLGIYNVQMPAVVLVGRDPSRSPGPLAIDLPTLRTRLAAPVFGALLMSDPRDMFAAYLLDRDGLVAFAGDGPLNTDLHPRVTTAAPKSAYEDDDTLGMKNLADLLAVRSAMPSTFVHDPDPSQLATFQADVSRFATALDLYLRAEAARVEAAKEAADPNTGPPMAAVEGYLQAYEVAPEFAAARGMLYTSASYGADWADAIFPRMIAKTPDEPRVWQAYLQHLSRAGDRQRFDEVMAEAQRRFGTPPPQ